MKKVLVADQIADEGIEYLQGGNDLAVDVRISLSEHELCEIIGAYEGVIVRSATKITSPIIEAGKKLEVIGRAGIGIDNIDIEASTRNGIVVLNTPDANATTTAELTIAHILSLSRHLPGADRSVRAGEWNRTKFLGTELANKTLGIIGYGTIGRMVASRGLGLKMRVVAYDPYVAQEIFAEHNIEQLELDDLLREADYVSLHCPTTTKTHGLINAERIALMKQGAYLINCARGELVDEDALFNAIKDGKLAGAALDVFANEPPETSPLLQLDSVVFTPHLGASTHEAQVAVGVEIANQVAAYLKNGQVFNAVNLLTIPLEDFNKIRPYLDLAHRLGRLVANMIDSPPKQLKVTLSGRAAEFEVSPIAVETLVGFLNHMLAVPVNRVNAKHLAERQGINLIETRSDQVEEYLSIIEVQAITQQSPITVMGTIFSDGKPRLVKIDEYEIEAMPKGTLFITRHEDRPGVVGAIGNVMGEHKINISRMHIGTSSTNSLSIGILEISSPLDEKALTDIQRIPAIHKVYQITL